MPKFFFHLRESDGVVTDFEGLDLPDVHAAQIRAITEARGLLAVELCEQAVVDLSRSIDVADEKGDIIHSLQFDDIIIVVRNGQPMQGQPNI